jgi:hypothetical protein
MLKRLYWNVKKFIGAVWLRKKETIVVNQNCLTLTLSTLHKENEEPRRKKEYAPLQTKSKTSITKRGHQAVPLPTFSDLCQLLYCQNTDLRNKQHLWCNQVVQNSSFWEEERLIWESFTQCQSSTQAWYTGISTAACRRSKNNYFWTNTCWNILLLIIFQYHYVGKYRNNTYISYLSIVSLSWLVIKLSNKAIRFVIG